MANTEQKVGDALPPINNVFYNSNMDVAQDLEDSIQTCTTTYNALTSYCCDGWYVLPVGASVTAARSNTQLPTNNKSRRALKVTGAASVTTVDVGQRIEAAIAATQCKQVMFFSAQIYNNTGASFTPTLLIDTPSATDDFTTTTNRASISLQACPDAQYTQVYASFDPSAYTNFANGLQVRLQFPSGLLVATKIVYVTQMMLVAGGNLVSFVAPRIADALHDSQRYFRSWGGESTQEPVGVGQVNATTSAVILVPLAPQMRAIPTLSVSAASDWSVSSAAFGSVACTGVALSGGTLSSSKGVEVTATVASGLVAGNAAHLFASLTTSARLRLSSRM